MSEYLTISETAKLLNKSTKTLRRWDEEGKLSAVREPMSNYRVYRKSDVETLFADFLQTDVRETVSNFVEPENEYKVLELFAGAGGLAVGMEKAGLKCVALNEIDKHACATLRNNRPNWNVLEADVVKIAEEGIEVIIANGTKEDILIKLCTQPHTTICTRFIPSNSNVSSVKKWIAHSEGFAKGAIYINENAEKALCGANAVSLLPIGVERIEGDFEKDDIVQIIGHKQTLLGVGKTQIDSEKARNLIGKKGQKPIIHYDYLYLE